MLAGDLEIASTIFRCLSRVQVRGSFGITMSLSEAELDRCSDQPLNGSESGDRRTFLNGAAALGTLAAFRAMAPSYAWAQPQSATPMSPGGAEVRPIDLSIGRDA